MQLSRVSLTLFVGVFIIGLALGGAIVLFFSTPPSTSGASVRTVTHSVGVTSTISEGSTNSTVVTAISLFTVTETVTNGVVTTTRTVSYSPVDGGGITLGQLESALNDSRDATLTMTSFLFLNPEASWPLNALQVSIKNTGDQPIVVSPHDCLLNGVFVGGTEIAPLGGAFNFGQYVYVMPGRAFTVSIPGQNPNAAATTNLEIYNNSWTFRFGSLLN
jgi:archaellum component FlaF (FlaF/FlaG flagellin family)